MNNRNLSDIEEKIELKKRLAELEEENAHLKIALALAIEKEHKEGIENSLRYVQEHLVMHTKAPQFETEEKDGQIFVKVKTEPTFCTWDNIPMIPNQPDWRKN